ncbi:MAG: DUF4129 domain-containing protein [Promethearchaeota archaeon]
MPERRSRRRRKTKFTFDLNLVKEKLATLQQSNRFREAIIYAYYKYLQVVQGMYHVTRRPSQTAREFAMDLVKRVKLPPVMIYPFTTLYEEARFGRHKIDASKYTEALQQFLTLQEQIMGGSE